MHKNETTNLLVLCKTQINYTLKKQNMQYVYQKRQQMQGAAWRMMLY